MVILTVLQCVFSFNFLPHYFRQYNCRVWLILSPRCSVVLPVAHMSCINLERAFTNTLFHWLCMSCIRRQSNSSNSAFNIYNWDGHSYTWVQRQLSCSVRNLLWFGVGHQQLLVGSVWVQAEVCRAVSPSEPAPGAGTTCKLFGQMVLQMWLHQRNLRWLCEIWGLTWQTLHGWVRKIPSCLSWRKFLVLLSSSTCMVLSLELVIQGTAVMRNKKKTCGAQQTY